MMISCLDDAALAALLHDDAPYGDLTTDVLVPPGRNARLQFQARPAMRVCGLEEAARLLSLLGAQVRLAAGSGDAVTAGGLLLEARGTASALLLGWKVAQNLVEWSSGVASAAAEIVAAARAVRPDAAVACTRKSIPGTKSLALKAVKCGGARWHRLGLSETLLVFPEHRVFVDETPEALVRRCRQLEPEKKVVVEVTDGAQAHAWALAGADVLQLEKFSPAAVAETVAQLAALPVRPVLAAAGGIHAENAAAYVRAGADVLVTSSPYTARPRDVSVTITAA